MPNYYHIRSVALLVLLYDAPMEKLGGALDHFHRHVQCLLALPLEIALHHHHVQQAQRPLAALFHILFFGGGDGYASSQGIL